MSIRAKNTKRNKRVEACRALNTLAEELSVASQQVSLRNVQAAEVEKLVRLLERRTATDEQAARLRNAAKAYMDNGGRFESALVEPDLEAPAPVAQHRVLQRNFDLKSKAFMLTYNGRDIGVDSWPQFRKFVAGLQKKFGARAWSACLEKSLHSSGDVANRHHLHAYFLWNDGVGIHCTDLSEFVFHLIRPRVDVCTTKAGTQSPKSAATHGLWYVSVMKLGTVCSATNFHPGVNYKPQAAWLQQLFQDSKVTPEQYMQMSATDFPLGHANRKRDVEEVLAYRKNAVVKKLVAKEVQLLKATGRLLSCRDFEEVEQFLSFFQEGQGQWRRPMLLIVGATNLGKSMLAANVLERVASKLALPPQPSAATVASTSREQVFEQVLEDSVQQEPPFVEVTVEADEHLDFADFDAERHAGVLLDGVGDVLVLKGQRETLQGRPKVTKGGRSATMKFSYPFSLTRRAVVATMDLSANNLHLLSSDHWLGDRRNIIVLRLTQPAWTQSAADAPDTAAPTAHERMSGWSVKDVVSFLKGADLEGPASTFFANGVSGRDFIDLVEEQLTADLRLSTFAAKKVLAARSNFLS